MSKKVTSESPLKVIRPTAVAQSMKTAFNAPPLPFYQYRENNKKANFTWEPIDQLASAISMEILMLAESINETVEMVKKNGCVHVNEFNIAVNKTNEDFLKFMADFEKIKAKHAGKSGSTDDPSEYALSITVAEDYRQFHTYVTGVMHHTLITFTEFALEAKDRERQREEQTAASSAVDPVATETPVFTTPVTIEGEATHVH